MVKTGDILNTRALIAETLCDMAKTDERIWGVTSDCGGNMAPFVRDFPDRFVDTGIAEQNAAGISAGLALSGAIPYILGMTPFVVMRAMEQNRTAIAYQNLPVRIIGWVGGMTSTGGSTHYAMEDVALMRAIANMKVVSISDPLLCADVIRKSVHIEGPLFIRLTMAKADPVLYEPGSVSFAPGKGIVAREGGDVTILAHGCMVARALKVHEQLKAQGILARVVDMCSIKPLDEELVLRCARETGGLIVWEDHFMQGGLASAVSDLLADRGCLPRAFKRIGIPETYPGFGAIDGLYRKYGMDEESVMGAIQAMLKGGKS